MNIILTGYRCTGKTSVGRLLAEMSGFSFFDTDETVVRRRRKRIAEIVEDEGWDAFRREESSAVRELSRQRSAVIATGGGVVLDPMNVKYLKTNGFFVLLVARAETIIERMKKDGEGRPSLSGKAVFEEVPEMLAQRESVYRRYADMIVDTEDLTEAGAASVIYNQLRARITKEKQGRNP
jgi:shikimate kinase